MKNTVLTTLDLSYMFTTISTIGARALAEALKTNRALTILDLTANRIGVEGTRALAQALKVNTGLRSLHLSSDMIGGAEGVRLLSDALKSNSVLTSLSLTCYACSQYPNT
eukprot:6514036-Prymnesium_polylepis.1